MMGFLPPLYEDKGWENAGTYYSALTQGLQNMAPGSILEVDEQYRQKPPPPIHKPTHEIFSERAPWRLASAGLILAGLIGFGFNAYERWSPQTVVHQPAVINGCVQDYGGNVYAVTCATPGPQSTPIVPISGREPITVHSINAICEAQPALPGNGVDVYCEGKP